MTREYHPLTPEDIRARLNGLDAQTIRQLAASAVGYAQARESDLAPAWRRRIVETYKHATRRFRARQEAARGREQANKDVRAA